MFNWIEPLVESYGMLAIFITMALESALVPIPSEIVVPLGGFLAYKGYFTLWEVVLATSLANLLGSIVAYYAGTKMGWIHRFSFLEEHLKMSNRFFEKHGLKAVFFGRMMPAVRTFISLPAGMAGVPFWEFSLLTFIGAIPWNFALAYLGYLLGKNWELVHTYGQYLTVLVVLALPVAYWAYRKYERAVEAGRI